MPEPEEKPGPDSPDPADAAGEETPGTGAPEAEAEADAADAPEADPVSPEEPDGAGAGATEPVAGNDPEPAGLTGRDRLLAAIMKPAKSQVTVAVLLAVVGFAAVVEVKANSAEDSFTGRRQEDLIDILDGLTGTTDRAQREIARLEETKSKLQSDTSARQAALDAAEERLNTLNILAGRVPVTGPGIKVVVTETDKSVSMTTLLDTVQELRTARAEAIEFNGKVRVVAQSSFETTSDGIVIDGVRIRSPYTIRAIGDPQVLEGAMVFNDGPEDQLVEIDHAKVQIQVQEQVEIRSLAAKREADWATPDTEQ